MRVHTAVSSRCGKIAGVPADLTTAPSVQDHLKQLIREVPDFPKPGITFYDITTLLKDKDAVRETVDALQDHYRRVPIDVVVVIEARG